MKKTLCFALALVFSVSLTACGQSNTSIDLANSPAEIQEIPTYDLIDRDAYYRDGKECMGYRIEIGDSATEDDMRAVFNDFISSSSYSYHLYTIWFYGLASDISDVGGYTVGMLEQTSPDQDPVFTPPSYDRDTIETMRALASAEHDIDNL